MHTFLIDVLFTITDPNHSHVNASEFTTLSLSTQDINGMTITERQDALNFRHRISEPGYKSDWHVAGDPTLIIVRQGEITLELKNGACRTYHAGEQFIAADYLAHNNVLMDNQGHKAYVSGNQTLHAVHIKLSNNSTCWCKKFLA